MTLEKTLSNLRKTKLGYFNTNINLVRSNLDWFIKDESCSYSEEKFRYFVKNGNIVSIIDYGVNTKYFVKVDKLVNVLTWTQI